MTVEPAALTDRDFAQFKRLIYEIAGISLSSAKKALVAGRLGKRLRELQLASYAEYLAIITRGDRRDELQRAVDLLTTNETFFFREEKHFDFLRRYARAAKTPGVPFRVWSAACASGEEVYSIAMVLHECLGDGPWEVVGSDISTRVLAKAEAGTYPLERADNIPRHYLVSHCLKGVAAKEGTFAIEPGLRGRVRFMQLNLNNALAGLGKFDVIFLRNVMIYFNAETKREVVERVASFLKPDGYLLISHSESLHGITEQLVSVSPSIYRRPV